MRLDEPRHDACRAVRGVGRALDGRRRGRRVVEQRRRRRSSRQCRVSWRRCLGSASPPPSSTPSSATSTATRRASSTRYERGRGRRLRPRRVPRAGDHRLPARRPAAEARRSSPQAAETLDKIAAAHRPRAPRSSASSSAGRDLYNAAAVCADGTRARRLPQAAPAELRGVRRAALLRAVAPTPVRCSSIAGVRVGVSICEDAWSPTGPIAAQAAGGAELVVNINASPYYAGRLARARDDARDARRRRVGADRLREPRRRPGRARVRRRVAACSTSSGHARRARQAVRRGPARRRPRRAARVPQAAARSARPRRGAAAARGRRSASAHLGRARRVAPRDRAAARARARGLRGARARHPRLRAQERLHRRVIGALGRHRLVARRRDRGRRARRRARARRAHAVALLERRQRHRRRGARRATSASRTFTIPIEPAHAAFLEHARADRSRAPSPSSPRRTCRRGSAATC